MVCIRELHEDGSGMTENLREFRGKPARTEGKFAPLAAKIIRQQLLSIAMPMTTKNQAPASKLRNYQ